MTKHIERATLALFVLCGAIGGFFIGGVIEQVKDMQPVVTGWEWEHTEGTSFLVIGTKSRGCLLIEGTAQARVDLIPVATSVIFSDATATTNPTSRYTGRQSFGLWTFA